MLEKSLAIFYCKAFLLTQERPCQLLCRTINHSFVLSGKSPILLLIICFYTVMSIRMVNSLL
jgi:hypothetical protein